MVTESTNRYHELMERAYRVTPSHPSAAAASVSGAVVVCQGKSWGISQRGGNIYRGFHSDVRHIWRRNARPPRKGEVDAIQLLGNRSKSGHEPACGFARSDGGSE